MTGPKPNYDADTKVKILREVEKKSFREIAHETGENVKNVHMRYRRAGGKLVGRLSTPA